MALKKKSGKILNFRQHVNLSAPDRAERKKECRTPEIKRAACFHTLRQTRVTSNEAGIISHITADAISPHDFFRFFFRKRLEERSL